MKNIFGSLVQRFLTKRDKTLFKSPTGDFYSSNIWKQAFEDYKHALEDGISIYSELVGFTKDGGAIQKGYDYGCGPGEYKMVVYRITYTKPDGNAIEFSWQQIKDRYNILAVYDDRLSVVKDTWFDLGLFVFCCNQGLVEF